MIDDCTHWNDTSLSLLLPPPQTLLTCTALNLTPLHSTYLRCTYLQIDAPTLHSTAGNLAKSMGWQWGFWAPGIIGLISGTLLLTVLKDKPEDLGYPPVEGGPVGSSLKSLDGTEEQKEASK
jgi:hypothetical protein